MFTSGVRHKLNYITMMLLLLLLLLLLLVRRLQQRVRRWMRDERERRVVEPRNGGESRSRGLVVARSREKRAERIVLWIALEYT